MTVFASFAQLQEFAEAQADGLGPTVARRIILRSSPLGDADLEALRRHLALPDSYLECAARFDLRGVSLGYFQVGPYRQDVPLVDQLRQLNAETSFEVLTRERLVIAGGMDADLLCVVSSNGLAPGRVAVVDIESGPKASVTFIAPGYGEFMLAAGGLWRLGLTASRGGQPDAEATIQSFLQDLRYSLADEAMAEAWRPFAEVLLL